MPQTGFALHPQLAQDTITLADWPLCRVLLMNCQQYPWLILVPRRIGIREIYELSNTEQHQLNQESTQLAQALMTTFRADKMNIAALGNLVPQLHLHHIVRYRHDPVWPNPVWGNIVPKAYPADEKRQMLNTLKSMLREIAS